MKLRINTGRLNFLEFLFFSVKLIFEFANFFPLRCEILLQLIDLSPESLQITYCYYLASRLSIGLHNHRLITC